MKKILAILTIVACAFLLSCKSDTIGSVLAYQKHSKLNAEQKRILTRYLDKETIYFYNKVTEKCYWMLLGFPLGAFEEVECTNKVVVRLINRDQYNQVNRANRLNFFIVK